MLSQHVQTLIHVSPALVHHLLHGGGYEVEEWELRRSKVLPVDLMPGVSTGDAQHLDLVQLWNWDRAENLLEESDDIIGCVVIEEHINVHASVHLVYHVD